MSARQERACIQDHINMVVDHPKHASIQLANGKSGKPADVQLSAAEVNIADSCKLVVEACLRDRDYARMSTADYTTHPTNTGVLLGNLGNVSFHFSQKMLKTYGIHGQIHSRYYQISTITSQR